MNLTTQQHQAIAARAQWYFDIKPGGFFDRGDNFVLTGQGLKDLNQALEFGRRYQTCEIVCEVGTQGTILLGNAFPKYSRIGVDDIDAIKMAFIAYWGSVDKPTIDPRPLWPAPPTGTYTVTVYPASGTSAGSYAGTIVVNVGAAHQLAHPHFPSNGTWWSGTLTGTYFDGIVGTL
jgi:hypothetical protein